MDTRLLDQALSFHGAPLLQQLEAEHEDGLAIPVALRRKYSAAAASKDLLSSEDKEDAEFVTAVQRFIAKKADILFEAKHRKNVHKDVTEDDPEDVYGIVPPLESFMHVPPDLRRQHFYDSLSVNDVVIGVVMSVMETGLVARLLCADCPNMDRDIDELEITTFCPSKELPRMFAHQSVTEAYQPRDVIRGIVLSVNAEKEKIILSLRDKSESAERELLPKIGLISKDDFPVHYRRKLQKDEMSVHQLLHSILGFTNKGSVGFLRSSLGLSDSSSLMRGLHRLKIPDEEYADKLRKWQAEKQARSSVEQGVAMVKKGKQLEAIQYLNHALKLDPDNTEALVARGAVYANNECYLKAIEDFQRALEADPKHTNARKYLLETRLAYGRSHEERGDLEDAEEDYKEILKLNPQSQEARERLERIRRLQAKDAPKERRDSTVIVSLTSSSSDEGDKLQKATETLKRLIRADDKDGRKASAKELTRNRSRKKLRTHHHRKSRHEKSDSSASSSESGSPGPANRRRESLSEQNRKTTIDLLSDSSESEKTRRKSIQVEGRRLSLESSRLKSNRREGRSSPDLDLTSQGRGSLHLRPQKQRLHVKERELSSDSSSSDARPRSRHSRSQSRRSQTRSQSSSHSKLETAKREARRLSAGKSKGSSQVDSPDRRDRSRRHRSSSSDSSSCSGQLQSSSGSSSTTSSSHRSSSSDSSAKLHQHSRRRASEAHSSGRLGKSEGGDKISSQKENVWTEKTARDKDSQRHGAEKHRQQGRQSTGSCHNNLQKSMQDIPDATDRGEGMECSSLMLPMKSSHSEDKHPMRSRTTEQTAEEKLQCGTRTGQDLAGTSEVQRIVSKCSSQPKDEDSALSCSRFATSQDGQSQLQDGETMRQRADKEKSLTPKQGNGRAESRYDTSPKEIVTKKGVPTVPSKWDSPVRRSRWDVEELVEVALIPLPKDKPSKTAGNSGETMSSTSWKGSDATKRNTSSTPKDDEIPASSREENVVAKQTVSPLHEDVKVMLSKSLGEHSRSKDGKWEDKDGEHYPELQEEAPRSRVKNGNGHLKGGSPEMEPDKMIAGQQNIVLSVQVGPPGNEYKVEMDTQEKLLGMENQGLETTCPAGSNLRKDPDTSNHKYTPRSDSRNWLPDRGLHGNQRVETGRRSRDEPFSQSHTKHVLGHESRDDLSKSRSPNEERDSGARKSPGRSKQGKSYSHSFRDRKLFGREEEVWVEKSAAEEGVWVEKTTSDKAKSASKGKEKRHSLGASASASQEPDPRNSKDRRKSHDKIGKKRKRSSSSSSSDSSSSASSSSSNSDTRKKAKKFTRQRKRSKNSEGKEKHRQSSPAPKKAKLMAKTPRKSLDTAESQDSKPGLSKTKIKQEPQVVKEQAPARGEGEKIKWTEQEDMKLNQLESFLKALKSKKTEQLLAEGKLKKP